MITLANYQILDLLYESTYSLVYRARRKADGQAVVLKLLKDEHPTIARIASFKREYEILGDGDVPAVGGMPDGGLLTKQVKAC